MISSTATYALRAVVFLADKSDRYISRTEISDATYVPHEYLLKVLNHLDAAGLVESRPGPGGGYRLRKAADELTSLEVVSAVDSIPRIKKCPLGLVDHEELCPLHQLLDDAGRSVEEAFAAAKISDLLPRKRSRNCKFPQTKPAN